MSVRMLFIVGCSFLLGIYFDHMLTAFRPVDVLVFAVNLWAVVVNLKNEIAERATTEMLGNERKL